MAKIWFINQFGNTPDMPGHTRLYEISKGLFKKGWEIDVFSSDFNLNKRTFMKLKNFEFSKRENLQGVNWYWLRTTSYKKNNIKRIFNMIIFALHIKIRLLLKYFIDFLKNQKPDLIIASSPHLPSAFAGLCIAKLFKIKFILEVRDLWPEVLVQLGGNSEKSLQIRCLRFIESILYRESEFVIVLAQGVQKYVIDRGAKKVIWLPNGPDLNIFNKSDNILIKNKFTNKNPFILTYAGAHGLANNLDNIVEAAKILKNHPVLFLFIGDGVEKKGLKEKSKNLKNIKFLDPIAKIDIPDFLIKSDAILFSLRNIKLFEYGISPNKLYDAYAASKPVVNTVSGSIAKEINEWGVGINALPENPKSLADSILKLMKMNPKERISMGKRGRKLAEKIYSREKIIKKLDLFLKTYI